MTKTKFSLAALVGVALVGIAAPASADPYFASGVNVSGNNGLFNYELDVNGKPINPPLYYAGAITYTMNAGTSYKSTKTQNYTAWCDDFYNDVYVGNYGSSGYQYYTENADNYLAGLSSTIVHEMAGLAFYGDNHLGNATLDTEVQVAIWEVEYGNIADPTNGGANQAVENALIASASKYYNNMKAAGDSYMELEDPTSGCTAGNMTYQSSCQIQGQLVIVNDGTKKPIPVPEPGTLGLLGGGFLGLAGLGLLRRRKGKVFASA